MNRFEPQNWTFPVPIAFGAGRLNEIGTLAAKAGMTRPLIITDRGSKDLPFIAKVSEILNQTGQNNAIYSDISPNPRDDEVAAGCALYLKGQHDGIIAVGGGSGMDGAKAVALSASNDIDLWSFDFSLTPPDMKGRAPFPPLICIPTTAGTGAETESTAMITDTQKGMKFCIWHPDLKPAYALLDPEITIGLPKTLTAWTGIDALVHAIEAYCVPDFHPLCDGSALEGMRLVNTWLRTAVHEPGNIDARSGMLVGSCLAGISFLKGLGLVHSISHMVGAEFDTHHGLTNAILLPAVLDFNAPAIQDRIGPMCHAMDLEEHTFAAFHAAICKLLDDLEIPRTLADIGVTPDRATILAEKAVLDMVTETNPRVASVPEIQAIIERALTKGR